MIPNLRTGLLTVALATPIAAQQFVAELDPNPSTAYDPSPSNAVAGNGVVYFSANSPSHGRELFVTDGTALGTRVFADLFPGDQPSSPRAFGAFGASAVVQVGSTVTITDGTPAGTRVLWSGVDSTTEFFWLGLAGSRFVWAHRQRFGDLWTLVGSDGTSNGTVQLALVRDVTGATPRNGRLTIATDVSVAQVFSTDGLSLTAIATLPVTPESGFAALGAFDYFLVDDPSAQTTLWRTDGTTAGTSFVAALGPTQGISSIATLGAQVVIGAGNQLWVSDGTGPGTVALPVGVTFVRSLTTAGNALVFTAGSSLSGGPRLWRTDGTAPGTFVLDPTPANYSAFAVGTTRTFCLQRDAGFPRLVRTDGTVAGTVSVQLLDNGTFLSLAALGNEAILTGTLGTPAVNTGLHAFRSDATTAGSLQLTQAGMPAGILGEAKGAAIESTLFFAAGTATYGSELWRTDGTPAGTQLVQDLAPGASGGVGSVLAFGGSVWFASGNRIYRHDGGPGPSVLALQPDPTATSAQLLFAEGGYLLLRTDGFATGRKLWRSDGTPAGTVQLDAVNAFGSIPAVVQMGDTTFWIRVESINSSLRRSDGTPGGTVDLGPAGTWLGELGDRVLFVPPGIGVLQMYYATATSTAAQLVGGVPFAPGLSFAAGSHLVCIRGTLDAQVFSTDGISTVTTLPLPPVRGPQFAADGFVYTGTYDPQTGTSLWRTDGTIAGTTPAISFGPGGLGSVIDAAPLGSGNRLFLQASDGVTGNEPWISQGTQATTTLLADLVVGGNSSPQLVGIAGERAYFVAFDPVRGRELWSFDLAAVGAANAQPFGVGCPGTNGVPRLAVDGMPAIGRTLSLRIDRGAPSSIGLWFVGLDPQHLSVGGGCEFLMTTIAWSDWAFTNAAGAAATSLFVPNDPVFVGLPVVAQGSFLDPLGVSSFGTTVTEGVLLVLGG